MDFPLVMNVRVLEKGLEEVVDVSGDESEHWCEVSVCVLVSVPHVLDLISPANLVCDVDLPSVSVSDCEIVEPQTFFLQQA